MLTGSIVAIITPMDAQGHICQTSLKNLVQYHIKNKTHGIVAVGTTGESATLSQKEHIDVVLRILEFAEGKIPVIAGTGANSTSEAISLTNKFETAGIFACLTVVPYYNRPTQVGLYQHFKLISENTDIPQILYNVPSRTGCDITSQTVIQLSQLKNIIGIKDATGDLSRINTIKEHVDEKFILISGDDNTALDFMQLGGQGVISVTANIAAAEMSQMCTLALKKDFINARYINNKLKFIHEALFLESNPIPIKWAAWKLGLIKHHTLRLPLTVLSYNYQMILKKLLKKTNIRF